MLGTDAKPKPARIVLFSGGSACRTLNIALSRMGMELTRVVPAWDSGGSSKELREAFDMLPVGDLRQALMTMAHGEGQAGDIVKICNARLSKTKGDVDPRIEFGYFASGDHPLIARMKSHQRDSILEYLERFRSALPKLFDFHNGSIGNFVLTGAYLAHDRDINAATRTFRELCGVHGNVWPVTDLATLELGATLKDGRRLERQHLVTTMDDADSAIGIRDVGFSGGVPEANPEVVEAIEKADAIVFGPGSFYTSILPHLMVGGIVDALEKSRAVARIFVGNVLECRETRAMTLQQQLETFFSMAERMGAKRQTVTHVIANEELFPFEKAVGSFNYLRQGGIDKVCVAVGAALVQADVEDAWTRGHHDGRLTAELVLSCLTTGRERAASLSGSTGADHTV